jgi:hypothetical protein
VGKRSRRVGEATKQRVKRRDLFNARPFAGLATESEWVALRELVPAATAPVTLADPQYSDRQVVIASVLPMTYPALVKKDGRIFLGVQVNGRCGDLSRDLAAVLEAALKAAPGVYLEMKDAPEDGPRLQDLLANGGALDLTLHESYGFWLDDEAPDDPQVAESLERANAAILPTVRLSSAESAYWCRVPDKAHLRWVLSDDETSALDALARLHAAGNLTLGEQTRYAGAFRAHGLLVPVFDLPREDEPSTWEEPLTALAKNYSEAVSSDPLSTAERQSRNALQARQITLR